MKDEELKNKLIAIRASLYYTLGNVDPKEADDIVSGVIHVLDDIINYLA